MAKRPRESSEVMDANTAAVVQGLEFSGPISQEKLDNITKSVRYAEDYWNKYSEFPVPQIDSGDHHE